ncbi:hypothetical protein D3C72_2223970 [compost metagenome]
MKWERDQGTFVHEAPHHVEGEQQKARYKSDIQAHAKRHQLANHGQQQKQHDSRQQVLMAHQHDLPSGSRQ